jgi:hypothetical protein
MRKCSSIVSISAGILPHFVPRMCLAYSVRITSHIAIAQVGISTKSLSKLNRTLEIRTRVSQLIIRGTLVFKD